MPKWPPSSRRASPSISSAEGPRPGVAVRAVVGVIRAYQLVVSPLLRGQCRFVPSCSVFASEAIRRHGMFPGAALAMHRVARCHPWQAGGYDPVPSRGA